MLLASTLSAFPARAQQSFSYVDLVQRLTDLESLATLPPPGDQCAQWSSYDRTSRYDRATGKYLDWDANDDGHGILRKEGNQEVLAEMEGPGCIWRMWAGAPAEGRVRLYLDGAAEPAVDLPFIGYFDGKHAPFTRSALVHRIALGWNNYTPIPYQKSCKIVAEPGWGTYYHFTYKTFPKGTRVPTFAPALTAAESAALDRANEKLAGESLGAASDYPGQQQVTTTINVGPGQTETLARLQGPAAIVRLRLKLNLPPAPGDDEALRELAIQLKWDGEPEPAVWAPFADFFGTAGNNGYRSLPLGHTSDGWWYCSWYMPFAQAAQLELSNDGKTPRTVSCEITHVPVSRPMSQLGRFHAKWHRDAFLPQEPGRGIDWPLLKTAGPGRFVGVMLSVWNPRGHWWGEGDEKFFVDGEKFPSTFGTGSEDYFGYAWCCPELFQHAYHNQTCNDGDNKGHISVNRWHIADSVPFQKSFEGCLEKYYPNQRPTLYAATAYWYSAPAAKDPYPALPLNERVGYCTPPVIFRVANALEGESLKVLSRTLGRVREQEMEFFTGQWSNDAQLWWTGGRPGDKLNLALPVARAGTFKVSVQLTKAPDYGIVQFYLDDRKLAERVDLYQESVAPSGRLTLGTVPLVGGDHKLTVELVGRNPKAAERYMFGLDYLTLEPLP